MIKWLLRKMCDHNNLAIIKTTYNTEEITCTAVDHHIECRICGKTIVEKYQYNEFRDLFTRPEEQVK